MKEIHDYGEDNMGVSSVKRIAKIGSSCVTIHHTMRDGLPLIYWFSMYHKDFGYCDFDIREYWDDIGLPEFKNWVSISNKARIDLVAQFAENGFKEMGINMIDFVKKFSPTLKAKSVFSGVNS